ncbi:Hypothetical protein DIP0700 [Corynebacterium diphtheriae]|uniref:Uncharacterized protein n=1 Tax=Corynebacterium diphtheriae (strain ATCC 700971 / NCTC 13129 / Biotype gravis) TaxID=257309 RepID=Q6NIR7_CORDI|nr:hypothetical protein CD31A_0703 [Corynebacterium diphtheriae 31A]AEX43705.1 hypothetical protein CD241_0638 [Corynebacterium diphtheriae 241]AEX69358.1 hypothetical protein CDPW8_0702 [Corynebacterium diphtheriae PW8]AEX71646.1 hypothetical protein CDCE8392_0648 [Corynebacterium diphtheriae CDCE 8392]AEX78356.1 hypothetical protein CDHC03_0625 [Corynebacterium diphtheriae HC03]AEX82855.1 hypothetical protein CDVA01_0586 [Corynebacterium diphtheriae VA01]CAE49217.1 Hypothetical protein DIP0
MLFLWRRFIRRWLDKSQTAHSNHLWMGAGWIARFELCKKSNVATLEGACPYCIDELVALMKMQAFHD